MKLIAIERALGGRYLVRKVTKRGLSLLGRRPKICTRASPARRDGTNKSACSSVIRCRFETRWAAARWSRTGIRSVVGLIRHLGAEVLQQCVKRGVELLQGICLDLSVVLRPFVARAYSNRRRRPREKLRVSEAQPRPAIRGNSACGPSRSRIEYLISYADGSPFP